MNKSPPDGLDHGDQMLAELRCGRKRHEDLVLPPVGGNLCDLDEPAARVLLHVEVEPLALQDEGARGLGVDSIGLKTLVYVLGKNLGYLLYLAV